MGVGCTRRSGTVSASWIGSGDGKWKNAADCLGGEVAVAVRTRWRDWLDVRVGWTG